jgi:hypothetical protein
MTGHRTRAEPALNMAFRFCQAAPMADGSGVSGSAVLANGGGVGWVGLIRSLQGLRRDDDSEVDGP